MISVSDLMIKAETALASAQMLFQSGDSDGACNRAYYAMFDAAKAALYYAGKEEIALSTKTHSGMIAAFSSHLVKTGIFSVELERSLNKLRISA